VNDRDVLRCNLFRSPNIQRAPVTQILLKENWPSAGRAYNAAIDEAVNDIIVFVHQDIFLPDGWLANLTRCLDVMTQGGIDWGVLGCFGVSAGAPRGVGRIYSTGWGRIGRYITGPEAVDTLDEIVLVLRKSSGLRFDDALPYFHLYGADLSLAARAMGKTSYAFPGYCVHNTNQLLTLPSEFYACYRYLKQKWSRFLPVQTSCIRISRFDGPLHLRRLQETYAAIRGKARRPVRRFSDPTPFAQDVLTEDADVPSAASDG
jgi:glycosyltransferase involved in cell wall biosynthesis